MWHVQCYDGCSITAGARGDVAARVQQIEPKTVCFELVKLIPFLPPPPPPPQGKTIPRKIKEKTEKSISHTNNISTRWTVGAGTSASIMSN